MTAPPPKRRRAQPATAGTGSRDRTQPKGPKRWGKVARHGAGTLDEDQATASAAWRKAMEASREHNKNRTPPTRDPEVWREDKPRQRTKTDPRPRRRTDFRVSDAVTEELTRSAQAGRAPRLNERLKQAADAYEHERFPDAARLLKPLSEIAPTVAGIRELYGLTLYRLGRYRDAAKELRTYVDLTGAFDQHPVLADCYRALKRWKPVDELWDELREAAPGAELIAEGRIVVAGARADRGDVPGAIELLEQARAEPKRPRDHHLRLWYALADLYERAGDIPKARRLFRRIDQHDPDFFDTRARARALQ